MNRIGRLVWSQVLNACADGARDRAASSSPPQTAILFDKLHIIRHLLGRGAREGAKE
jgi:hypothetical protein